MKGGALITASLALDQGVPVFAVPGDVNRRTSRGCNLLIRDGAFPALDPDELIEDLRLLVGAPPKPKSARAAEPTVGWLVEAMERVHPATIDNLVAQSGRPVAEVVATVGEMVATGDLVATGDTYIRSRKGGT